MRYARLWPLPGAEIDEAALAGCYPREAEPTLRMNFVASADGAATVDGRSGGLGGPGDKLIFDTLRMVCDALVVAAGTVRAEKYDALRLTAPQREWREARGLPAYPMMVVVSRSLDLDPEQLIFGDAPVPPVVLTGPAADPGKRRALADVAEVITMRDLAAGLAELRARGAGQVLCEGGPSLFGSLIAGDLVDELCLTVAPLLTAGDAGRIAKGPPGPAHEMSLRQVLTADDTLFLRYARR